MTKKINLTILFLTIVYSIYCALQLGYTWDVLYYHEIGKDRLNYLFSLGNNEVEDKINSHKFITGTYATISAFFVQIFPSFL